MKQKILVILLVCSFFFIYAKEYSAAILQLPGSENYVNLFKAIGEETNNTFNIQIVPPGRGIFLIENNQTDIMFPSTVSTNPKKIAMLKYDYSTAKVYKMVFVLYSNKKNPIDIAQLKAGNPKDYKIETTASLSHIFEFDPLITTNLEGSLKKVDDGTIDGFLYAQEISDPLLKKLMLKNIIRKLYSTNDISFAIKKGTAGGEIDKILIDGIAKLKSNGRLNNILEFTLKNSSYIDWQP